MSFIANNDSLVSTSIVENVSNFSNLYEGEIAGHIQYDNISFRDNNFENSILNFRTDNKANIITLNSGDDIALSNNHALCRMERTVKITVNGEESGTKIKKIKGNKIDSSIFDGINKYSVTSVQIPYGVEIIGPETFRDCSNLNKIDIPDTVRCIGEAAFLGCVSLENIKLPSELMFIGARAFKECANLTDITIPGTVKDINEETFMSCDCLTEVKLQQGTTTIGEAAFAICINLNKIDMPSTITNIEASAFCACDALAELSLPEKLEYIGEFAFSECNYLTDINIPSTVNNIGEGAFSGCINLRKLCISDSDINMGKCIFKGCDNLAQVLIGNDENIEEMSSYPVEELSDNISVKVYKFVDDEGHEVSVYCCGRSSERAMRILKQAVPNLKMRNNFSFSERAHNLDNKFNWSWRF